MKRVLSSGPLAGQSCLSVGPLSKVLAGMLIQVTHWPRVLACIEIVYLCDGLKPFQNATVSAQPYNTYPVTTC